MLVNTPLKNNLCPRAADNIMYLCIDFDGVIADGVNECLIVSWLAWHSKKIPDNLQGLLESIPAEFQNNFRKLRNYVRFDAHFMAPHLISTEAKINSQRDFDETFATLDGDLTRQFTSRFQNTRNTLRTYHTDEWLAFHTVYPGMQSIFDNDHKIFIISGKDANSISAICQTNNIQINNENIYGGLMSKKEVLSALLARSKNENHQIIFCDDNLPNVIESKTLGINTYWAGWGYHSEEHVELAKKESIHSTSLSQFLLMIKKLEP